MLASMEGKCGQECCTKEVALEPGLESCVKVHFRSCQALRMLKVGQGNEPAGSTTGVRVTMVALLPHMHLGQVAPFPCLRSLATLPPHPQLSVLLRCLAPSPLLAPTVLRASQAQWSHDLGSAISWPSLLNAGSWCRWQACRYNCAVLFWC